jgi:hypothetical protein
MGYLSSLPGDGEVDSVALKRAVGYGAVMASFTVEGFGVTGIAGASRSDVERRFQDYREMLLL